MKRSVAAAGSAVLVIAAVALFLQRAGPDGAPQTSAGDSGRLPILMIHGSGLDASSWDGMVTHLRNQGWPADYLMAVQLRPNDGANIPAAEAQLLPAAQTLLARAQARATQEGWPAPAKLAVVGHSMGAVSGRWLAAKLIPGHVAVFIGIAGAHHGTDAVCGLTGAGNDELCPAFPAAGESPVLEQLNGTPDRAVDPTPYGAAPDAAQVPSVPPDADTCISWYSLSIDPDEWITPAASARLPGSGGAEPVDLPRGIVRVAPGEFRLAEKVRHDDLPATPAVMAWVTSLLTLAGQCSPV
jgi:pimeloyl-ACP methyl ester carboxylesterase